MVKFDDLINNNMFKCLLLVIIGYCVAKMFYNSCNCFNGVRNGFSVGAVCPGGENVCTGTDQTDFCYNKQVIPKFNNNKPGCYPQFYNYSTNCNAGGDTDKVVQLIEAIPGKVGRNPERNPRCFSWDRDNDPRNAYDCQLENGIESCKDDVGGDQLIEDCRKYCNVTMAACMAVEPDGTPYQLPNGELGYKCRELTLRERKNYTLNGDLDIINGGQVYEGDDALEQCRAAGCGITCLELANNIDTCQPNKEDQVAYKDIMTCMPHCKHVFVCRKGPGDECYKTYRIPIDEKEDGEKTYDEQSECERNCEEKNHWCDDHDCKCVEDIPEIFCAGKPPGTCYSEDMCNLRCKPQNMYEYRCPLDDNEYKMGGSQPGCAEFLCKDSGCGPYGFDSNSISAGGRAMLEENCNSGSPAGYNIKDEGDRNALYNVSGTRENDETCNLECSTDPNHFQWGKCTNIANQCRKEGTIIPEYNPTGIFSGDDCDISNKLCTDQDNITDCNVSCTISEPSASGCIVDIDEGQCYYDMTYKDVYGRSCPSRTHQISCVGLDKQSDLWRGNLKNASDCDLFGSVEDLKTQLQELSKVVANNASNIDDLQGRVGTLERKFKTLRKRIKNLETNVSGIYDTINNLDTEFKGLEENFKNYKNKVNELKTKIQNDITELQINASALSGHVDTLDTNVSGLQGEINSESGRVDTLYTNVSGLQSSIGGLSGRVGGLETNVSGLSHLMHDFESGLSERVGKLNHNVIKNTRILAGYHRRIFTIKTSINSFIETVNAYLPQHDRIDYS